MKAFKVIALIGAMLFLIVGVDKFGWAISWLPFIGASWLVLSDKELMGKFSEIMDKAGF